MHEMSMNFDMDNVELFLNRITHLFDSGFGQDEISKAVEFTSSLNHDDEKEIQFGAKYLGKDEILIYRVFMDDIDAPDIYFFTSSASLSEAIGDEYDKMCEELGI